MKIDWKIIALVILALMLTGYITNPFATKEAEDEGDELDIKTTTCPHCFGLTDTDVILRAENYVNGSQLGAAGLATIEFFNTNDESIKAAADIDAYPDSQATLPTCQDGYYVAGEDDGAPDWYWRKESISWECQGQYDYPTTIKLAEESGVTYTGYDDGTSETTWNITVGTTKVTSAELKIESEDGRCIGNPYIGADSLAICINGSAATLAKFNSIKPTGVSKTIDAPSYLTSEGPVLGCYVLPTSALCDGAFFRFYLTITPISNPGTATPDVVYIHLIDKTLYKDDDQHYQVGWEDSSDLTSDADIGITVSSKALYFT